jgi:hypothetical protein
MVTSLATAGGRSSPAADWSNSLEAAANGAYVTNPTLVVGSHLTDETAQVILSDHTTAETERGQLTVTPQFSATRYKHESNLDITAGSLDLTLVEKLERGQWSFEGLGLTDSTVTSELGTTGVTNVNRRHTAGSLSLSYQYSSTERLSWQVQGSGQLTRYSDAAAFGLVNYDFGSVQFGPMWSFSERVQGSLILEADRINPEGGTKQNDYSAYLQLKRSFSEKYAWRASVGGTRIDYGSASASAGSQTSSLYEVGASRKGERVQWDVSVKHAVLPIGIGLLAPETVAAFAMTVATSERGSLSLTLNGIRTEPVHEYQYLVYSGGWWGQVGAEWKYQFTTHWALSAGYLQGRARYSSGSEWATGNQARLGILWQSGRL